MNSGFVAGYSMRPAIYSGTSSKGMPSTTASPMKQSLRLLHIFGVCLAQLAACALQLFVLLVNGFIIPTSSSHSWARRLAR